MDVTRGVYKVLEKMAEVEIERDPVAFIRRESLQVKKDDKALKFMNGKGKQAARGSVGEDDILSNEEFKDAIDGHDKKQRPSEIYTPELIDELEEVFHDAHDHYVQTMANSMRIT